MSIHLFKRCLLGLAVLWTSFFWFFLTIDWRLLRCHWIIVGLITLRKAIWDVEQMGKMNAAFPKKLLQSRIWGWNKLVLTNDWQRPFFSVMIYVGPWGFGVDDLWTQSEPKPKLELRSGKITCSYVWLNISDSVSFQLDFNYSWNQVQLKFWSGSYLEIHVNFILKSKFTETWNFFFFFFFSQPSNIHTCLKWLSTQCIML